MDAIHSKGPYQGLHVSRFADPMYFTTKEFGWDPDAGQETEYAPVRVPVGFVTDFASVPRLFWSLFRPDGLYAYAAVVHDYLYWEKPIAKEKADNIFKFLMQNFNIAESSIFTLYNAVRLGGAGAGAWNDNAKRRTNGEKRILKRLPDDPTVRWADWKLRRTHFSFGTVRSGLSGHAYQCKLSTATRMLSTTSFANTSSWFMSPRTSRRPNCDMQNENVDIVKETLNKSYCLFF